MEKQIQTSLRELHLPAIRACYKEQSDLARAESHSYEQYLLNLIGYECQSRLEKRIARFLKESKLPLEKSLSSFDRKRLPQRVNAQLSVLLDGTFLDRCENILAFGNPGSGKTHLLCAIAQELIVKERRALFRPCNLLVQEMLVAKRDLKLPQYLKRLVKYDAVIIDDIGYVQQNREEMEVLFTLLADRYERGSVMITSNLPFSKWEVIFKDPMTTAAAIDRLVHHSIILELNISSYRLEQSQKKRKSLEQNYKKGSNQAAQK
ncbi:MAG: IS21-like element helper ATPase IstB [Planctomycetota bacterium]|jgi:DNA replication protein DnaC